MKKQQSNIPKSSQLIVGQPIYQQQPPRQTYRVPVYQRPLYPMSHSHSHTTVFVPMVPPISIPMQTKIIRAPVVNLTPRASIPTFIREDPMEIRKRRIEQQTPKFNFMNEKTDIEQDRNQDIIRGLLRQNKLVKEENEELRIQNMLLIQKMENLNKKIELQQKYFTYDKGLNQTDTQSRAFDQTTQNRLKRAKSFQFCKQFKTQQFRTPHQQEYYGPSIINCCDKCAKCVLQNKDKNQINFLTERANQHQHKQEHHYTSRQRESFKTDYDDRYTNVKVEKPKQKHANKKSEKTNPSTQAHKSQDVNSLIKRLKDENKALKRIALK